MNVLIGCEFTGIVRDAFAARGHNAYSCDVLASERPGKHLQMDIIEALDWESWDFVGLHLPCTKIALCGNRHYGRGMKLNMERQVAVIWTARVINKALVRAPKVYFENPANVMGSVLGKRTQKIQPYQFGHTEQKETWLWLYGLPALRGTDNVYDEMMLLPKSKREKIFYMSPGSERGQDRSRTFPGIAAAMADQWG